MSLHGCLPVPRLGVPTALELGEKKPTRKKKGGTALIFFTSKHGGRKNISFCLLTLAIAMALRCNATVSLQAACLSTSDVCHIPFCPCSAVSQPHPQNNKSFAKQCHSSMRRRCTVKSGKFPVWRMETCPRGSSRQCSHLSTEPVSSAPKDSLATTRTVCGG